MFKILMCVLLTAGAVNAETVELGTANTVTLRGPIDDASIVKAASDLYKLVEVRGSRDYTIYIAVDSPGGDIESGENFIELVKTVPNVKTVTIFAASMASAIVQALPGERLMIDSGVQMFHRARGGVSGQFETGELESRLEFYKRFVRRMEIRNAKRMGMSLKFYKSLVKDELWMTSDDAIGIAADKVVDVVCTKSLRDKVSTIEIDLGMFSIPLNFSGCPLLRMPVRPEQPTEDSKKAELKYLSEFEKIGALK